MGVGAGLYMYDVVVKSSLSLSHLLMSSQYLLSHVSIALAQLTCAQRDTDTALFCLCVCPSVTRPYCVETAKHITTHSTLRGSPGSRENVKT